MFVVPVIGGGGGEEEEESEERILSDFVSARQGGKLPERGPERQMQQRQREREDKQSSRQTRKFLSGSSVDLIHRSRPSPENLRLLSLLKDSLVLPFFSCVYRTKHLGPRLPLLRRDFGVDLSL